MSIWTSASRLVTSSRCLHVGRFLVGESSSSRAATTHLRSYSIRNSTFYSTTAFSDAQSSQSQSTPAASLPQSSGQESPPASTSSVGGPPKARHGSPDNALGQDKGKEKEKKSHDEVSARRRRERRRRRRQRAALHQNVDSSEKKDKDITRNSKSRISGEVSARNAPTFDSQLVRESWKESWKEEPWSADKTIVDSSNDYRSFPPHVSPKDVLHEGIIEYTDKNVLVDVAPMSEHLPVARLSHGLDRILFNPGVHWLRDPRSHVYNFTPWLEKIPKVTDFAFERLTGFIKSSRDKDLRALARQENRKFAGSTSSLSGMLSHIYFLLSEYKEVDCTILSQHFRNEPTGFTAGQRMPATVMLNYKDGIYAIDSHAPEWDDADKNVLTWMGTLLENVLTKSPEEFKTFMRIESAPIGKDENPPMREAFRFAKSDNFVMRSQLDCQDDRLPGTGVFDIKTRACVSIRMDILNYEENAGYMIKSQHGIFESFEREYYDLIRSAFLKYNFQVRIGNMDGVMVTYHNTERIFGFQYISRDEMDERLFGPTPGVGDKVFNHAIKLLEAVLEEASNCFPEQSVICGFETRMPGKVLDVFVQPAKWTGGEEERPIVKLAVTLEHELNGFPVRASSAMRSTNEEWKINYQISRVNLPEFEIMTDYKFFMQRKKRSLVLPSSVSLEEAEEYWGSLNFGNKMPEEQATLFRPEAFSLANPAIEKYRELSREGRLLSLRIEEELASQPKIVLGKGVYEEEENLFLKEPYVEQQATSEETRPSSSEPTPAEVLQADAKSSL